MRTVEHFYERAKAKRLHPERALKKEALNYLFCLKFGPGDSADEKVTKCHFCGEGKSEAIASRTGIKKLHFLWSSNIIWARRDSNPRPRDYESPALPRRHRPVTTFCFYLIFNLHLPLA